jgi:hypothetical protein
MKTIKYSLDKGMLVLLHTIKFIYILEVKQNLRICKWLVLYFYQIMGTAILPVLCHTCSMNIHASTMNGPKQ